MIYKMVALSEANGISRLRTRGTFGHCPKSTQKDSLNLRLRIRARYGMYGFVTFYLAFMEYV